MMGFLFRDVWLGEEAMCPILTGPRRVRKAKAAMRSPCHATLLNIMRAVCFASLLLLVAQAGFGQAADTAPDHPTPPGLPKDAREILAVAAPLYNFSDPSLTPWHLRASYQLYDEKGEAAEKGTFEYWWASPQVYRTSWTRGGTMHTDWHTGEGKRASRATGEPLKYFEYKLSGALLSPLPAEGELDPAKSNLVRDSLNLGGVKLQCVMVGPIMRFPGQVEQQPQLGLFPTYCFDSKVPVLRARFSMGSVIEEFNRIAKVQGRFLPQSLFTILRRDIAGKTAK